MNICIFCSANSDIDPVYVEKTSELGRYLAARRHTVIFGGCDLGLMECVAEAARRAGGHTVGIVPGIVEAGGHVSGHADEVVHCENLTDRKALMMERSDLFVALPGGIGTLDEIFTVASSHTIGYHRKPVVLYNINGFWSPLIALLDDMSAQGMIRGDWKDFIAVADDLDGLDAFLH